MFPINYLVYSINYFVTYLVYSENYHVCVYYKDQSE